MHNAKVELWGKMKKFILLFIILLNTALISAQELADASGDTREDKTDNKAISFSFNGVNANGYNLGVGGRYWIENDFVYFGSLSYGESQDNASGSGGYTDSSYSSSYRRLSFGFEKHLAISKNKDVSPYTGADIYISKSKSSSKGSVVKGSDPYDDESVRDTKGVSIFFGVEYYINESISFSIHYSLKYSISDYTTSEDHWGTSDKKSGNSTDLYTTISPLILSVYF